MKLQFKFLVPVFLLFGTFFALFFYSEYLHSEKHLEQTILAQGRSIDHIIRATRLVYHREFLASDFSITTQTQAFLPSHTMRKISAQLAELTPDQSSHFRGITTTPYSNIDKATDLEKTALDFFTKSPQTKERLDRFKQDGQLFFQYSTPTYIQSYCLECHPESHCEAGDLNGIFSITLSANKIEAQSLGRQQDTLVILVISLVISCLFTMLLFRKLIHSKLEVLHTISQQNISGNYHTTVDVTGNDELDNVILSLNQMSSVIADREAELLKAHEFSSAVLSNISDAVSVIDLEKSTIVAANNAFLEMHGVSYSETIGQSCHKITRCQNPNCDEKQTLCPGKISEKTGEACRAERVRNVAGRLNYYDVSTSPICTPEDKVVQVVRVARNITENKHQEEQIRKLAYYDALTGLPNRTLLYDRMHQTLLLCEREKSTGVIAFLDLDLFKEVNDTLGHAAGDNLLQIIAKRLLSCVRESDTVARLGGDEFLIILHELSGHNNVTIMAEQLLEAINKPITLNNTEFRTSASLGMCFYPRDGTTVDALLKCADSAMYEAKRKGRNTFHLSNS